jgi:putative peptidoglycan lipid II flippase
MGWTHGGDDRHERVKIRRLVGLSAVSAIARLPGFLVPVAVAAFFGAGHETDAFFLAYSIMLLVGGTSGQAVEVAIVPFAVRSLRAGRRGIAWLTGTAWRASAIVGTVWFAVLAGLLMFTGPGSTGRHAVAAGIALTGVTVGWVASAVFSGALVSSGRIATATASMLWRGAGAGLGLLGIPFGAGLLGVAAGLSLGELARAIWLRWYALRPQGSSESAQPPGRMPVLLATGAQAAAGVSASAAALGERLLATSLPTGSLSILDYATRLLLVPGVVFDGAVAPALLSRWSRQLVHDGRLPTRDERVSIIGRAMLLAVLLAMAVMLWAPVLVQVLLHHGQFSARDADAVAALLRLLAVGFVGTVGATMTERLFIAASANHWLAMAGLVRGSLRVGIAAVLIPALGLRAVAVGFGVAEWSYLMTLLVLARRITLRPPAETQPA